MSDPDADYTARALAGLITTDDAYQVVAVARAQHRDGLLPGPQVELLDAGDRRLPEDEHPARYKVIEFGPPAVDADPDTTETFDRLSGNGSSAPTDISGQHLGGSSDGELLLDELHDAFTRYVAFPSAEAADAVTLHIAATHAQTSWEHATRLVIKSPVRRCGKTRLLEVAVELAHQVLATTNISVAALVRSIGLADPPTIVLDEADAVFATRRGERSESAEDLRGILNSGHARGWPYIRWDATTRKREECPTFAMAILAGIGDLPDTIEDRSVIVTMRRRAPGEQIDRFRRRRAIPPLHDLRDRLHAWIASIAPVLTEAEPDLPVEDRAADVWEPLVAIADAAGGDWPERARRACKTLARSAMDDEADGTRLLTDLYAVFGDADVLATATILDRLNTPETSPWGGWHRGDGLNARDLSKMLKSYNISPKVVRIGDSSSRGYTADMFRDAWARYVPGSRQGTRNKRNTRNVPASDVALVTGVTDDPPGPGLDDVDRYEADYPDLFNTQSEDDPL